MVLNKTRFTNGFIRAVINEDITITSYKASDYFNYPFSSTSVYNADNFASFLMFFDYKIFGYDRFIIKDQRLFSSASTTNKRSNRREVRMLHINKDNEASKMASDCYLVTETITWLEADPENCTCINPANCDWATGCTDCSNQFSTSMSYWSGDCGGSGGGSTSGGGVTWNPAPPPGGGGSNEIASSSTGWVPYPDSQEYQDFVNYTLTQAQQSYWNDPDNAGFVSPLIKKLVDDNYSDDSRLSVQYWLNYLMRDLTITPQEFQNYFINTPEGADGIYNAGYWEATNLFFQPGALPSFEVFISAFPKIVLPDGKIKRLPSSDVYSLVGGTMNTLNKSGDLNWQNACAVRCSRALNYSGKPIEKTSETHLGSDGKNYIVSAKAFNKYMNKKYGPPTYRLTQAQIAGDPEKIKSFLKDKNGIYTMVTNGGSFTGHADLIIGGTVLGGSQTEDIGIVEFIEIWELK